MHILGYREASMFKKHASLQPKWDGEKKATQTPENHMLRFLKEANMQFLWTEIKEEFACLSNTVKDFIGLTSFSDSIWLLLAWKCLGILALGS